MSVKAVYKRPTFQASADAWQNQALCRRFPSDWWFPTGTEDSDRTAQAISICSRCPVRRDCAIDAVQATPPHRYGIWAGIRIPDNHWDKGRSRKAAYARLTAIANGEAA